MKWTRQSKPFKAVVAVALLATTMVLGGCNTLGGALWGAYIGAESGSVEGMIGGTIVGAGVGLVADVGSLLDGLDGHEPYHVQEGVVDYYYPCSCDACRAESHLDP